MNKSDGKIRLLLVEQILLGNRGGVSMHNILNILENVCEIRADRKTVYSDLQALTRFYNVQMVRSRGVTLYKIIGGD